MRSIIVLLALSLSVAAQSGFGAQQVISTSALYANTVRAVDLDGDGDLDVLSAALNKIAWYENLGGGNFGADQAITTNADSPTCVYATDLDGDGDNDVLVAVGWVGKLAWYENMGAGTFGAEQVIEASTSNGAWSVYATDLDGDGDNDVLSACGWVGRVAWYENMGGGVFGGQQVISYNVPIAQSVFAIDLDGDGDSDVLSTSADGDRIAWHENLGGGTFAAQQVITANADFATCVYATDLDGDGDPDVLSSSLNDDKIAWYENMGGGTFGAQQVITTSADGARSAYATDLDGDGDADVLSASQFDDKIAWYENTGGGTFGPQKVITTSADRAFSVYAADLDGDGAADVLSASVFDDTVAWYANQNQPFTYAISVASNDVTFSLSYGESLAPYFILHSNDPLNATLPGLGLIFGLHIGIADVVWQLDAGIAGNPLFGGTLGAGGDFSMTIPDLAFFLAGQTWWGVGIQQLGNGTFQPSNIASITF